MLIRKKWLKNKVLSSLAAAMVMGVPLMQYSAITPPAAQASNLTSVIGLAGLGMKINAYTRYNYSMPKDLTAAILCRATNAAAQHPINGETGTYSCHVIKLQKDSKYLFPTGYTTGKMTYSGSNGSKQVLSLQLGYTLVTGYKNGKAITENGNIPITIQAKISDMNTAITNNGDPFGTNGVAAWKDNDGSIYPGGLPDLTNNTDGGGIRPDGWYNTDNTGGSTLPGGGTGGVDSNYFGDRNTGGIIGGNDTGNDNGFGDGSKNGGSIIGTGPEGTYTDGHGPCLDGSYFCPEELNNRPENQDTNSGGISNGGTGTDNGYGKLPDWWYNNDNGGNNSGGGNDSGNGNGSGGGTDSGGENTSGGGLGWPNDLPNTGGSSTGGGINWPNDYPSGGNIPNGGSSSDSGLNWPDNPSGENGSEGSNSGGNNSGGGSNLPGNTSEGGGTNSGGSLGWPDDVPNNGGNVGGNETPNNGTSSNSGGNLDDGGLKTDLPNQNWTNQTNDGTGRVVDYGNIIDDMLGDNRNSSYDSPDIDWGYSNSGNHGGDNGVDNLDDYFNGIESAGDLPDGITLTDDFPETEIGENNGEEGYYNGEDGNVVYDGQGNVTDDTANGSGQLGDFDGMPNAYQEALRSLDGSSESEGDSNSNGILGDMGDGSSLKDKINNILGGDKSVANNKKGTVSDQDLFDYAKKFLLANGYTAADIASGKNYDMGSAYTEPSAAWDMNRITTLLRGRKISLTSPTEVQQGKTSGSALSHVSKAGLTAPSERKTDANANRSTSLQKGNNNEQSGVGKANTDVNGNKGFPEIK